MIKSGSGSLSKKISAIVSLHPISPGLTPRLFRLIFYFSEFAGNMDSNFFSPLISYLFFSSLLFSSLLLSSFLFSSLLLSSVLFSSLLFSSHLFSSLLFSSFLFSSLLLVYYIILLYFSCLLLYLLFLLDKSPNFTTWQSSYSGHAKFTCCAQLRHCCTCWNLTRNQGTFTNLLFTTQKVLLNLNPNKPVILRAIKPIRLSCL